MNPSGVEAVQEHGRWPAGLGLLPLAVPTIALMLLAFGVPRGDIPAFAAAAGIQIVAACGISSLLASQRNAWAELVPVLTALPNPIVLGLAVEALVRHPVLSAALLALPAAGTWVVARSAAWRLVKGGGWVRFVAAGVALLGWIAAIAVTLFAISLAAVD